MADKLPVLFAGASERLTRNERIRQYHDFADWIWGEEEDYIQREIRFFHYIKQYVLRKYRHKGIYISPSALEDLIFFALQRSSAADLEQTIDQYVIGNKLDRRSVVVFPLHSFGLRDLGVLNFTAREVAIRRDNFLIVPQTNSFERSQAAVIGFLDAIALPNRRSLKVDLLRHFYETRSLKWFDRNALMLLTFRFSQLEPFDNLHAILNEISFVTNKLYFMAALTSESEHGSLFSTRTTNNFETFDIKHFITIASRRGGADIHCLPIFFSNLLVFEDTHLNVDLDVRRAPTHGWTKGALESLDRIHVGYRRYLVVQDNADRKYNRLARSLKYFRKAVKSVVDEDTIVNLNTAFEIALLDDRTVNKRDALIDRAWKLLRRGRQSRKTDVATCLEDLVTERNRIIHAGEDARSALDKRSLFQLYCRVIWNITTDLKRIDSTKDRYLTNYFDRL